MKCNFVVGQQVVCINDKWPEITLLGVLFPPRVPMINEVLTISKIEPSRFGDDGVYLQFTEIPSIQSSQHVTAEVTYTHTHFAPLNMRETDISVFKAMLTPAGRIPVDA